jgi:Superfamily II DNA helicase
MDVPEELSQLGPAPLNRSQHEQCPLPSHGRQSSSMPSWTSLDNSHHSGPANSHFDDPITEWSNDEEEPHYGSKSLRAAPRRPLALQENPASDVEMEKKAKNILRHLLKKPNADWSCEEQRKGVLEALRLKNDIVAVMKTGSGKTMIPVIPAMMEQRLITVIVLPLKSLVADYVRRFTDMGIPFQLFMGHKTQRLDGIHNIILVSADMAKTPHWKKLLAELNERVTVGRMCFDESQVAFTADDFRVPLTNLYDLRAFAMQIVLLTGTCSPRSIDAMMNSFGIGDNCITLRTSSDRPELEYILEPRLDSTWAIVHRATVIINHHKRAFQPKDRALVFVPYLDQGERIAEALGCEFYSGDKKLSDKDRERIRDNWFSGHHNVMVATAAFGAGNDCQSVRVIVHAGTPQEIVGY